MRGYFTKFSLVLALSLGGIGTPLFAAMQQAEKPAVAAQNSDKKPAVKAPNKPSSKPSAKPSASPSSTPSPKAKPSATPSTKPSDKPTAQPNPKPSAKPTANPTQSAPQPKAEPSPQTSPSPNPTPIVTATPKPTPSASPSAAQPPKDAKPNQNAPNKIEELISLVTMEMRIGLIAIFGILILLNRKRKKRLAAERDADEEQDEFTDEFDGDFAALSERAEQTADPDTQDAPLLRIDAKPVSLGRSFANITLNYTLSITNMGATPIKNLGVEGEITSAHGDIPESEQLADSTTPLTPINDAALLAAGATKQFRGELRMPINTIRIIRQGQAYLYVPLLRLRFTGENIAPSARTYVVGRISKEASARLQPFRLDEMAQTYYEIGLRQIG